MLLFKSECKYTIICL